MSHRAILQSLPAIMAALLMTGSSARAQSPSKTAFNYQGVLKSGGVPATGAYDFQFLLYNASVGGSQIGPILKKEDLPLTDGLVKAEIDFGDVFDGSNLWLEVGVRPGGSAGNFTPLVPRQRLASVPYASYSFLAGSLPWAGLTGIPAGFADGTDNDTTYAAGTGLTLAGGKFNVAFGGTGAAATAARSDHTQAWTTITGVPAGFADGADNDTTYTAGNGLTLTGTKFDVAFGGAGTAATAARSDHTHAWSTITGIPAGFADGTDNDTQYTAGAGLTLAGAAFAVNFAGNGTAPTAARSDHFHISMGTINKLRAQIIVNNAPALRLIPADPAKVTGSETEFLSGPVDIIGGAPGNSMTAGVVGGTVSGGGGSITSQGDFYNKVTDHYGTVGGGIGNTAGDDNETLDDNSLATVAGGSVNTAYSYGFVGGGFGNSTLSLAGVIAGGWDNRAEGQYNAIGGGYQNSTNGSYSFVGGGQNNIASGSWSAVLGGANNVASAITAIALGTDAHANHSGTLVFGDGSGPAVSSTTFEQVTMRASNGYLFFTNPAMTTGVILPAGAGGWSNISDVNTKTAFSPIDSIELLKKLAAIPIQSWSYKSQAPSIRHIGPTAQDFRAAFGMGEDEKHINTVDSDGVALTAIQGLYRMVQERDDRIRTLQSQNANQDRRIKDLEARMAELEKWMKRHP